MIVVTVLYPKTATSHFDFDYYVKRHVPLLQARWNGMGLTGAELLRGTEALDGAAPAFALIGKLFFASKAEMHQALAAHGGEVIGDIPNYTDVQPLIQVNEVLAF